MKDLWITRLKNHQLLLLKYLRYVLNDHFVVAIMFFIGGLGLAYSNGLKVMPVNLIWYRPALIVGLLVILQIGRLSTLLKEADVVFLLPQEYALITYLKKAKRYSTIMASLMQLGFIVLLIPVMIIGMRISLINSLFLILTQLCLKNNWLTISLLEKYQNNRFGRLNKGLVNLLFPIVLYSLGLYGSFVGSFMIAILSSFVLHYLAKKDFKEIFDWKKAISFEENRMLGIYRFFNLFTDVPMVKGQVKRRAYLDFILNWIKKDDKNVYAFLYARGFIRGTEFSGLFIRLTLMGSLILAFISNDWLAIAFLALFIYLIGFQLLPFAKHYDNIIFTRLYPRGKDHQIKNFKKFTLIILVISAVFLNSALYIGTGQFLMLGYGILVSLIEIILFTHFYLVVRVKKILDVE
ncbi:ABC transporter permease [Dellaglioa sp. L3N]